jgi:CHAT domain-containing protein
MEPVMEGCGGAHQAPSLTFHSMLLHQWRVISSSHILQCLKPSYRLGLNIQHPIPNDTITAIGIDTMSMSLGARLPFVEKEINMITSLFGHQAQQLKNPEATFDKVIAQIQSSSWLHLACHGLQDPADPLKSALVLYDGMLELSQILDLNLPNAKFVYLSACETAMGDSELTNEAMHLAGGFIAAGFQGAIGTLWSMSDAHGPKVAEVVYRTILGEDNIPDVKMAAKGLHFAIQKLRMEGAPLHQWMPFIHLGI